MQPAYRHLSWVVLTLLLGVFLSYQAGRLQAERLVVEKRTAALLALTEHRARFEGVLNATLHVTGGLASLIAAEGGLDEERFHLLAADLVRLNPHVRNIALAPDNVIRMVHPLRGNEGALGLAYRDTPAQWPAVQRAMVLRRPVVAGPLELRQGGLGIVQRIPVFLRRGGRAWCLLGYRQLRHQFRYLA